MEQYKNKPSPYQWATNREGYPVLIRTKHPRFAIEVQDDAENRQLADALCKAAEFVVKGRMGKDKIMTLQPNTDFEVWANIEVPYEGTDALLPSEVHNIRMDYPFSVVHGDYNVYPIRPCNTLNGLIAETQRVFRSLWDAGLSDAPHCLEDFVIECIIPHPNNLATIVIGS